MCCLSAFILETFVLFYQKERKAGRREDRVKERRKRRESGEEEVKNRRGGREIKRGIKRQK